MSRSRIRWTVGACLVFALAFPATADDVSKKWRLGLAVGGTNPVDDIPSAAANRLILRGNLFEPFAFFEDPRNDSAAFGNLDVQSGVLATFSVQYGINKIFLVEGSVGYGKNDLGDVSVDVNFLANPAPIPEISFNFDNYRVRVGEVERVPIQLTALARFRPRASFNPYFGAGIGYVVQGFSASDEFNDLSRNMDAAQGTQQRVTDSLVGNAGLISVGGEEDLSGATVSVRDTFEWHLVAGAELSFKRKWAIFGDLRWVDASRNVSVGFNGGTELGSSVPQFEDFIDSELGRRFLLGDGAGPVRITSGGLIDGGQIVFVRREGVSDATICDDPSDVAQQGLCESVWLYNEEFGTDPRLPEDFEPDGELDPGFYYAQGGSVAIDGFSLVIGVRYTF